MQNTREKTHNKRTAREKPTRVQFFVTKDYNNEDNIFAFFPDINFAHSPIFKETYSIEYGSDSCSKEFTEQCRAATPEEYAPLKMKLEAIGYNLQIVKKVNKLKAGDSIVIIGRRFFDFFSSVAIINGEEAVRIDYSRGKGNAYEFEMLNKLIDEGHLPNIPPQLIKQHCKTFGINYYSTHANVAKKSDL
jgi:hypothetical protein